MSPVRGVRPLPAKQQFSGLMLRGSRALYGVRCGPFCLRYGSFCFKVRFFC